MRGFVCLCKVCFLFCAERVECDDFHGGVLLALFCFVPDDFGFAVNGFRDRSDHIFLDVCFVLFLMGFELFF